MALDYNKNISPNSWSLSNSEFVSQELNKRLERYKAKKEVIENLLYEQDIIRNDIIEVLRTDVNRSDLNIFMFWNSSDLLHAAWLYFNQPEKCEDSKNSYEEVIETLKRNFFPDYHNLVLKEVINFWYGAAYEFVYEDIKSHTKFELFIPIFSAINKENWQSLINGYHISYEEKPNFWSGLTGGFDIKQIAADFNMILTDGIEEFKKYKKQTK